MRTDVAAGGAGRSSAVRGVIAAVLLLAGASGCRPAAEASERRIVPESRWVGGIPVREIEESYWAESVTRAGLNTVAATVYAHQGDWDSDDLRWDTAEEPGLVRQIRAAKQAGLRVVLILRVSLNHAYPRNRHLWHGMILPRDEARLDRWFVRYTDFVAHFARMAEAEGVDMLGIGSEMSALSSTRPVTARPVLEAYYLDAAKQAAEHARIRAADLDLGPEELSGYVHLGRYLEDRSAAWRAWAEVAACTDAEDPIAAINARRAGLDARWRGLAASVRAVYGGAVTYAANFDQYQEVGWWDALDGLGVNAYFPLRAWDEPATAATFEASWVRILRDLQTFAARPEHRGRKVWFTELGYSFRKVSTVQPWAGSGLAVVEAEPEPRVLLWERQPQDDTERQQALTALARVAERFPGLLQGVLYWKLSTDPRHLAIEPFAVWVRDDDGTDPTLAALRALRGG